MIFWVGLSTKLEKYGVFVIELHIWRIIASLLELRFAGKQFTAPCRI